MLFHLASDSLRIFDCSPKVILRDLLTLAELRSTGRTRPSALREHLNERRPWRLVWQHGRAAGFLHRLWFHQFGSREIWIIEVQLPFAVASDLWLLLFWRVLQQAPLYQRFVGGVRVRHAQCEVIHYAAGVWVVGIFY